MSNVRKKKTRNKKRKKIHELVDVSADPCQYLPSEKLVLNTLVGVEFELENIGGLKINHEDFSSYWKRVEDGSLRDQGAEFVLSRPFAGRDLITALEIFKSAVSESGHPIRLSERTSVHVHIDVRDLTYEQLIKFICLYIIFEGALFNIAGEERKNNIFSTALSMSEGNINLIGQAGYNPEPGDVSYFLSKLTKYSACNISAVLKYGSLEFRNHKGTYDTDKIINWINILLSLKKSAISLDENIENIFTQISSDGIEGFVERVFGNLSDQIMYPDLEFNMYDGIRLAQDIIHSGESFNNIKVPEEVESDESVFSSYYKSIKPKRYEERRERMSGLCRGFNLKGLGTEDPIQYQIDELELLDIEL